jgi:general stress protein CsbA
MLKVLILSTLLLQGCAAIERHPYVASALTIVAVGSIAASAHKEHSNTLSPVGRCGGLPASCATN